MLVLRSSYSQIRSQSQHDEQLNLISDDVFFLQLFWYFCNKTLKSLVPCSVQMFLRNISTWLNDSKVTKKQDIFHRGPFKRKLAWDIHNQLLPASFFSQVSLTLWCASFLHYVHSSSVYGLCVTHSAWLFNILHLLFHPLFKTYHHHFVLLLFSKKSTVIILIEVNHCFTVWKRVQVSFCLPVL